MLSGTSMIQGCTSESFLKSHVANTPTNDMIRQCFLAKLQIEEHLYVCEMESIEIGSSISFDHT